MINYFNLLHSLINHKPFIPTVLEIFLSRQPVLLREPNYNEKVVSICA